MATIVAPESALQQIVNVDNLGVTLEGARVLSQLYGYDAAGDNWDRLRVTAAGLVVDTAGGGPVDTELPAAVAAADNLANPTAPFVLSAGMLFDGATWDRAPGSSVDGALVNLGANNDVDTELPAAAALADATVNPTVPAVGSFLMGFNSATWDRLVSSIAQGLEVDVTRVQGSVAVTNAGLTELAAAINASRMDVNIAASIALDVSAATVTVDSELPAAAALADNTATPTVPAVGAFGMVFDGAAWDFMRGTSADGVLVNLGANNDVDTELPAAAVLADGAANPTTPIVGAAALLFNGTTFDRQRNNEEATILASAARVANTQSAIQTNFNARGAVFFLDVTVNPGGAQTLQLVINMEDPVSGGVVPLVTFLADDISAGGTEGRLYTLYPGATEDIANGSHQIQGLALPRNYRVDVIHSGAGSWTYSLGVSYIN